MIPPEIASLCDPMKQISTLAGNQVPSYFVWEALFTMVIIGMGLFLYALLIGNMQNFLQALGQRYNFSLWWWFLFHKFFFS
jgi:cyclic nucleotide gated channel